jgi:hypothetical protein
MGRTYQRGTISTLETTIKMRTRSAMKMYVIRTVKPTILIIIFTAVFERKSPGLAKKLGTSSCKRCQGEKSVRRSNGTEKVLNRSQSRLLRRKYASRSA